MGWLSRIVIVVTDKGSNMNIRQRRINSDFKSLIDLTKNNPLIDFEILSNDRDKFIVTYRCRGLQWLPERPRPNIIKLHKVEIYLHTEYPRLPPRLQWLTDIFHPNILPPAMNGGVCIGKWSPSESLGRLVVRIGRMVQYQNYSTTDALNLQAAAWAKENESSLPVDDQPLDNHPDPTDVTIGAK
ncbi:MAG: ubiquitin-conjugating enzyme E2 [Armatimonadota bacterium]